VQVSTAQLRKQVEYIQDARRTEEESWTLREAIPLSKVDLDTLNISERSERCGCKWEDSYKTKVKAGEDPGSEQAIYPVSMHSNIFSRFMQEASGLW